MIKLFILDIDGVLTDGSKTYDSDGRVLSKRFNDKDWTAIKRMKAAGVIVVALSGDVWNSDICKRRNIPFYLAKDFVSGVIKKSSFVDFFEKKYKVKPEEMAYIGDDIFDVDIMDLVGYPFCPGDAVPEVINSARTVNSKGGENVMVEVYQDCVSRNLIKPCSMDELRAIDAQDK